MLLWWRQFEEVLLELGWEKSTELGRYFLFIGNKVYSCRKTWMTSKWLERNRIRLPCGRNWWNLFSMCSLDALNVNASRTKSKLTNTRKCSNHELLLELKNDQDGKSPTQKRSRGHDMEGHAKKCVEKCCELANKKTERSYKVSTPCLDDHHFKKEELESVGELSNVCSQIVLKCLYLAQMVADILLSVNKLARSITKWTGACDRRSARLI